ncbi:MAG: hypothetical protein ABI904_05020 [Chloroflexota bacterium]
MDTFALHSRLSGAKAACSTHGSPSGWRNRVRFSGLPRTEAGLQPAGRVVPLSVKTLIFYH